MRRRYVATCLADHEATFDGVFARLRLHLWWIRHDKCESKDANWCMDGWDDAYCINGCGRPAVHNRLAGMAGDTPVYEMLCCVCANKR